MMPVFLAPLFWSVAGGASIHMANEKLTDGKAWELTKDASQWAFDGVMGWFNDEADNQTPVQPDATGVKIGAQEQQRSETNQQFRQSAEETGNEGTTPPEPEGNGFIDSALEMAGVDPSTRGLLSGVMNKVAPDKNGDGFNFSDLMNPTVIAALGGTIGVGSWLKSWGKDEAGRSKEMGGIGRTGLLVATLALGYMGFDKLTAEDDNKMTWDTSEDPPQAPTKPEFSGIQGLDM